MAAIRYWRNYYANGKPTHIIEIYQLGYTRDEGLIGEGERHESPRAADLLAKCTMATKRQKELLKSLMRDRNDGIATGCGTYYTH